MYLEHFSLNTNPFSLSPKLDFLYKSQPFEESVAHLLYGLDNSEAIILITGAIGTGKTMAIQSFLTHLGDHFTFALVTNTRVNAKELLKLVLEDLGVPLTPGVDKSDLLILFKDYLIRAGREGKRVLIVIDEAQNLDHGGLEEIRLLTNLGQGDAQPVQIVLLGQPELVDIVNQDNLAQLRQRIRVHYHLDHLTRKEVEGYVRHRMLVAGCDHKVFSSQALDRVYELSNGVPRVVNTLAGEALLSAFVDGRKEVQPNDVGDETHDGRKELVRPQAGGVQVPPLAVPEETKKPIVISEESPSEPIPEAESPVMATRTAPARAQEQGGSRKRGFGWIWAVVLLLATAGTLFATGALDGVLRRNPSAGPSATQTMPTTTLAEQPSDPAADEMPAEALPEAVSTSGSEDEIPAAMAPTVADTVAITQVKIEAAPTPKPVAQAIVSAGTHYGIHVSSFHEQERASALVSTWMADGYPAFIRTRLVDGSDWHRVYLGPYSTAAEARAAAKNLKAAGRIAYYMVSTFQH